MSATLLRIRANLDHVERESRVEALGLLADDIEIAMHQADNTSVDLNDDDAKDIGDVGIYLRQALASVERMRGRS